MEPVKNLCIDDTLAHHWNIEPAKRGVPSKGICIKCNSVKRFNNSTWVEQTYSWKEITKRKKEQLAQDQALQDMVEDNK